MSAKNLDKHNRWRNKTVAFRMSAAEDIQLETLVKLTGLTKQDYIIPVSYTHLCPSVLGCASCGWSGGSAACC